MPEPLVKSVRRLASFTVVGLLTAGAASPTPSAPPALKAAFLFNFAKFAEWPKDAAPLVLCVVHDPAAEDALVRLVSGASIDGRPVTVAHEIPRERIRGCHLLYVGSDNAAMDALLTDVKGAPVLTVGDGEPFARERGIVGLLIEGNRMRFAINADAAQRSGVRLSSKLLTLATLVP
jgi:hypothetical protein